MCYFNLQTCCTCGVPRTLLFLISCGDCGPEPRNEIITTNLHKYTWYGGDQVNELGRFIYPDGSTCRCIDPPLEVDMDPEGPQTQAAAAITQEGDHGFQNEYQLLEETGQGACAIGQIADRVQSLQLTELGGYKCKL